MTIPREKLIAQVPEPATRIALELDEMLREWEKGRLAKTAQDFMSGLVTAYALAVGETDLDKAMAAARADAHDWRYALVERVTTKMVDAEPFEARQCPAEGCGKWIYTAAGPFAENDPTKTMADCLHWEREHATAEERAGEVVGFPFMMFNEQPVRAILEPHEAEESAR